MSNNKTKSLFLILSVLSLAVAFSGVTEAGDRSLLLYAQDQTFLPIIEDILNELWDWEKDRPVFDTIINLNKWSIGQMETQTLDEFLRYYESSTILRHKSDDSHELGEKLVSLVRNADSYIRIDVIKLGTLLDFHVLLTDSLPDMTPSEFPALVTESSRLKGFVVDLTQSDYLQQLRNSLMRLFPQSNRPPIARISIDFTTLKDGYYYFGVGDTIIIDASDSYDLETPRNELTYHWRQLNHHSDSTPLLATEMLPLDQGCYKQVVHTNGAGEYHLAVQVSDGISHSDEYEVRLRSIYKPFIIADSMQQDESYNFISDKAHFLVHFLMIVPQNDTASTSLLFANASSVMDILPIWHHRSSNRPVNIYDSSITCGCDTTIMLPNFDSYACTLHVECELPWHHSMFELMLMPYNDRVTGDVEVIYVDFQDKGLMFHFGVSTEKYFGRVDSSSVHQRAYAVQLGIRVRPFEKWAVEFGSHFPVYRTQLQEKENIFPRLEAYAIIGHVWNDVIDNGLCFYYGDHELGIGYRTDFSKFLGFPLTFDIVKFQHPSRTLMSMQSGFESSWFWAYYAFTLYSVGLWLK